MNPEPRRNRVYGILNKPEDNNNTVNATDNATAQADTIADVKMPNVKNKNPKSDWEQLKDGVTGFGKMAGKSIWEGNKATSGLAGMAIGGALAGLSGQNIANTIGSMAVGKKIQDHAEEKAGTAYENAISKWEQHLTDTNIRNNERTLATAYSNFRDSGGYKKAMNGDDYDGSDEEWVHEGIIYDYLDMNKEEIEAIQDEDERIFAQALHAMKDIYRRNPDEHFGNATNEKIINTMSKIRRGEIKPNAE